MLILNDKIVKIKDNSGNIKSNFSKEDGSQDKSLSITNKLVEQSNIPKKLSIKLQSKENSPNLENRSNNKNEKDQHNKITKYRFRT